MLESANLSITWFLVGLIWIIQVVHYPSFAQVGENEFQSFHQFHTKSITWIVAPLMTIELLLTLFIVWKTDFDWSYLFPLLMVLGIWASTVFLQIPLHTKLALGNDVTTINKLVSTNWIRTVLWTAKGVWLAWVYAMLKI